MIRSLTEDELDIFRLAFFETLLKVSAAMLVFAQAVDLSLERSKLDIAEASRI